MKRIKITNLPEDCLVNNDELKLVKGGDAASDLNKRIEAAADQFSSSIWLSIAQCMSNLLAVAACGIGSSVGSTGTNAEPKKTSVLNGAYRRKL